MYLVLGGEGGRAALTLPFALMVVLERCSDGYAEDWERCRRRDGEESLFKPFFIFNFRFSFFVFFFFSFFYFFRFAKLVQGCREV